MGRATEDEFRWLFQDSYGVVTRVVYVLVGDRVVAEEIAQEAFARLYAHWPRVSGYERPGAWVRRVAVNLALNARTRRRIAPLEDRPVSPAEPEADLHRAILTLPRAQRGAVALHYFEDRPVEEVARILGCSKATVKVHLHRARKRLAVLLAEEDAGVG